MYKLKGLLYFKFKEAQDHSNFEPEICINDFAASNQMLKYILLISQILNVYQKFNLEV